MALRVRLLGGLDVEGVEFGRLGSRKARTLLARLALGRGQPVPADALIEVVWPDPDRPSRPGDQLSVLVSRLRAALGVDRFPRHGTGYALRADWLDVDARRALVEEARRRLAAGGVAPARAAIDAALALDRGALLPDEPPADWLDAERAHAARTAVAARLVAAEVALAAGDPWAAADAAWVVLSCEPFDEAALRALMVALAASGRPAQALLAYTEMAKLLSDELGVDPTAETTAVYLQILRAAPRADEPAPASQQPAPPRRALPGRTDALRALDEAYRDARAGAVVVVGVQGEAGIGKTRLLESWVDGLPADARVLRAHGSELGGGLPLQPVLDAVAAWLRRQPSDADDLLAGTARLLAPLVGAEPTDATAADQLLTLFGEAGAGVGLLFTALDTVVGRLAPLSLVIDDAHWLDRSTLAWLRHLPQRLGDLPVLIVVAHRPDEGAAPAALRTVELGPLDRAAVALIVGEARAADLHARSGGHPLFLVELAHTTDERLPESVRDAVIERCARTGAAAATLRAAAVLGPDVDLDLVAAVLDTPPAALLDHLEEGVRRGLLVEHGTGFGFRHQLIREALQAATGSSRTALLHRSAAHSLRARGRRADPWDVAYHARLGGDLTLAASALADAGELAAARFDHDEALRLFDQALTAGETPELRLRRARVALPAGRFQEAATDAGAALGGGLGAPAMEVAAIAAYLLRDFGRCRRLANDGATLASDPQLRTSCLALAGRVSHVDGDLDAADTLLRAARETAPPDIRPLAQLWSAPLRTDRGDPAAALDLLGEPVDALAARHPFVLPHRHLAAAQALGMLGRAAAAMAELALVDEVAAHQHTERFAARVENCRAWILRNTGSPGEADTCNQAAYARSVGVPGMTEPVADALLGLADGRLRVGDIEPARVLLRRAAAEAPGPHPFAWRHDLRRTLIEGRCALAAGDRPAAEAAGAEVAADAQRLGIPRYEVFGRLLAAQARRAPAELVEPEVLALARVAPLEAGWLTAALSAGHEHQ